MRISKVGLFGSLVGLVALSGAMMSASPANAEALDKVIVVVNDEVVTQREFDRVFTPIKTAYESNFQGEELEKRVEAARKGVLDQLVDAKLIISLAKKKSLKINEEELKKRVFFTILMLGIYRVATQVPTPGVDGAALSSFFDGMKGSLRDRGDSVAVVPLTGGFNGASRTGPGIRPPLPAPGNGRTFH